MGWQGPGNTEAFLTLSDCQVVAACDIDASHLQSAVKKINDTYGNEDWAATPGTQRLMSFLEIKTVWHPAGT